MAFEHSKRQRSGAKGAEVLRRLELDINKRLDGMLHGDHQGLTPGHGSEPGEARGYQPGDDVRRIDWNVTARSNELFVREAISDRELETWIVADASASLSFGTADWEKSELVTAAAAGVGFLTTRGGNRVGALIASPESNTIIPARSTRRHMMAVLDRIAAAETRSGTSDNSWGSVLRTAGSIARNRGLIVAISDWLEEPDTWRRQLAALAMRHEVLVIEVLDPREMELPAVGVLTLIDTETGQTREVNTNNKRTRADYQAAATEQRESIRTAIAGSGARHLQLRTDSDWLADLAGFVTKSKRRRAYASGGAR